MRKSIIFLLLLTSVILTSSCSNKTIKETAAPSEDDFRFYKINENISSFDVDEEGNIYYITFDTNPLNKTDIIQNDEGSQENNLKAVLKVLNSDGTLKESYILPVLANNLCLTNGKVLYTEDSAEGFKLLEYDKITETSAQLCELPDYSRLDHLEVVNNKLIFIGINKAFVNSEYSLANPLDTYSYSGERIGYFDLSTGSSEELDIDLPITFSGTLDGNIIIYAYDEVKGYYFTEYDIAKKSFSEKIYHDMGMMNSFTVFNKNKDFLYLKLTMSMSLTAASLDPDSGDSELISEFPGSQRMKCRGEYTYSPDSNSRNILRIKNAAYFRGSKKISVLSTDSYKIFTPFGCGYSIQHDFTSEEEMALSLLSQDNSYDIFCINSRQDISANIRNKGSFYPLNDVKGVTEYLDACFPYIKEAAVNSDRDIWMLPITVDIPCFLYNDTLCRKYGIELSDSMQPDGYFDLLVKIEQDNSLLELTNYNNLIGNFFYQYLRSYSDFNSSLFRNIAESYKTKLGFTVDAILGNPLLPAKLSSENNTDFLFMYIDDYHFQLAIAGNSVIRACSLPSFTDNKSNVATCYYLCVNPASKNRKEALQYISSLCAYLTSTKNTIMSKNREDYPDTQVMDDLYSIYSNGDIRFTYPDELFMDDFKKYLTGEKDLESMINDANRRLDTFLNE